MTLTVYRDALFELHSPPDGYHMEGPWRLARAIEGLRSSGLEAREEPAPRLYDAERLARSVHDDSYVELVKKLSARGGGYLDADTYVGPYTFDAALAVVASVADAALNAIRGAGPGLVLGRPPGHHAGRYGAAMGAATLGFCIFNATAAAARMLADIGYRVYILDFDLHHGNGTQEILYDDARIIHIDIHQDPSTIYPGTGWPWETGEGEARGTKVNVALPPGSGDDIYTYTAWTIVEAVTELHGKPDIVLVDAGFDAYVSDGLGAMYATTNTYRELARITRRLSDKVVVVLEGGYSIGLERGLPAYISELTGTGTPPMDEPTSSNETVWEKAIKSLKETCRNIGAQC